jgi:hypothetical protein
MAEALAAPINTYEVDPQTDQLESLDSLFQPEAQVNPIEAVTDKYEPNMLGKIREAASTRFNKVNNLLRRGGAVMLGSLAMGGSGLAAETASADTTVNAPQITSTNTNLTIKVAGSNMSESQFSRATVIANYRTISKAKIKKLEKQGKCEVIDGKKVNVWTQGHTETGRPYGIDTRKSLMCKNVTVDKHGDKHTTWYRAACGNKTVFHQPKKVVQYPIWVNSLNSAHITVKAKSNATAQAECKTENTSAMGFGHGEGSASATATVRAALKAKSKKLKEMISSGKVKAEAEAKSTATAKAAAICIEQSGNTPPPATPPKDVCPNIAGNQETVPPNYFVDQNGNCVQSKDGTQGPGAGTPGNTDTGSTVGGPGAGGQPGNTTESYQCYDSPDSQNGDLNPNTEGGIMYVDSASKVDQMNYCVGPAKPAVNG